MMFFYWWVLVQIVVESLPVSSSGHQKLFEHIVQTLSFQVSNISDIGIQGVSFRGIEEALLHVLHIPSLLVIAIFFYPRWSVLVYNWRRCLPIIVRTILYVGIADSVTTVWYIFFKIIHVPVPLWVGFFITAMLLFSLWWCPVERNTKLDVRTALLLGCVQGIALISGISRFAITVVCASWLGFSKRAAFETSFLIQIPLIAAASVRGLYSLWHHHVLYSLFTIHMGITLVVGMAAALLLLQAIFWLYQRNLWWLISIYMIVPILAALAL